MVNAPRFTVLMPTHARPDVIGYAIASVLAQTVPDFELLIVGDGVSDDTRAVVAGFADPRIRFFDLPKGSGFGYANRNIALREARSELIALASDDDLMLPDHLALMGAALADPGSMLAYGQSLWVSSDGIAGPDLTNLSQPDELARFMRQNSLAAGVLVYRRTAFAQPGPWPEHVAGGGDWWMWKDIIARHSLASLVAVREVVQLHFSATRRRRRDGNAPRLRAWLKRADGGAHWPAALKLPIAAGEPPQAAYARALRDDPHWVPDMRRGVRDLTDHLALEALARIEFWDRPRHIVRRLLGKA